MSTGKNTVLDINQDFQRNSFTEYLLVYATEAHILQR